MKYKIIFFLFVVLQVSNLFPAQFSYPVADLGNDTLFVLYQQSIDDVELWSWNKRSGIGVKELSSMFTPSDVQIMPGGSGFSFLDRGRIWIKSFHKRMPKSIDVLEPLDSIYSVSWLTDELCYFSARHYRTYDVFLCDISKGLQPKISFLTHIQDADVLYPCKHDDSLYCALKDTMNNYSLVRFDWEPVLYQDGFNFSKKPYLLYATNNPICSVSVESDGRGVLVECLSSLSLLEEFLLFSCSVFDDKGNGPKRVFEFSLPTAYLLHGSSAQLRESITRFLPHYIDDTLYFSSYDATSEQCCLYRYSSDFIERVSCRNALSSKQLFSPLVSDGTMYYGMILTGNVKRQLLEVNPKTGTMEFELPCQDMSYRDIL